MNSQPMLRDNARAGSLLDALDRTVTPMGARLLGEWVVAPLAEPIAAPPAPVFIPSPWSLLPPPAPPKPPDSKLPEPKPAEIEQRFDPPQPSVPMPLALPAPAPVKTRRKRQVRNVRRVRWDAEEFAGELSDRVRSNDSWEEVTWQNERVIETVEDLDDVEA